MDSCIVCDLRVRPRQEALLCEGCDRWQHRTANAVKNIQPLGPVIERG